MESLEASRREVPVLLVRASSPSTNSELASLVADAASGTALDDFTTVVTDDQTAGRGRLDRSWTAPAGTSLAISVLVLGEPLVWLPLAAGIAMTRAVESAVSGRTTGLKWPNDVQIEGRKVSGILCEVVPGGVIVGAGVNTAMSEAQLPVPTATSLVLNGAVPDAALPDRLLAAYLHALVELVGALRAADGDADRSGLRAELLRRCTTLGREVRVELPGGSELRGTAVGIDAAGRLEVRNGDGSATVRPVAAGDVIHLR